MKPIIEVKNVSKRYQIREKLPYYSLRDEIVNTIRNPLMFTKRNTREYIWALKNITFNVIKGEVVGIIGQNGAGKSTLLKILSQITPPTKGAIRLRGRIASLLEVGTGFHPELTGRENIFLSGAILGMKRSEIKKKFDEIVDFSGVEKFIDTPAKHYSSGMQVRLGFSVAAHLEADILLVDEVLAVGDVEFQKKCLGKMDSARREGRTVLFVSHNLSAITSLCHRVILLKSGEIVKAGEAEKMVFEYLQKSLDIAPEVKFPKSAKFQNKVFKLLGIRVHDENGVALQSFDIRKPIGIDIDYQIFVPNVKVRCNVQIKNGVGVLLFNSPENDAQSYEKPRKTSVLRSTCWIPGNFLAEGLHTAIVSLYEFSKSFPAEMDVPDAITFNVFDSGKPDSVKAGSPGGFPGLIRPKLEWERIIIENR